MILNSIANQYIVVKDNNPLLYTSSNNKEITIRKFENKERRKVGSGGEVVVKVDIYITENKF